MKQETSLDTPVEGCPWWICFAFDNPLRRLVENPHNILSPYVKPGMTVLDVGPGMGYFTIEMARLVGEKGRVIASDIQSHMLEGVRRRARRAGMESRIDFRLGQENCIGLKEALDFTLAHWMVHEVRDRLRFVSEIASVTKPGGLLLVAEPRVHVSLANFTETVADAVSAGFGEIGRPPVFFSYTALLRKR